MAQTRFNPYSEATGSTPVVGVAGRAPAARLWIVGVAERIGKLRAPRAFREGAENHARGGRAPVSISEIGFNFAGKAWIIAFFR